MLVRSKPSAGLTIRLLFERPRHPCCSPLGLAAPRVRPGVPVSICAPPSWETVPFQRVALSLLERSGPRDVCDALLLAPEEEASGNDVSLYLRAVERKRLVMYSGSAVSFT